jgi:plasmid replication initiation protein
VVWDTCIERRSGRENDEEIVVADWFRKEYKAAGKSKRKRAIVVADRFRKEYKPAGSLKQKRKQKLLLRTGSERNRRPPTS